MCQPALLDDVVPLPSKWDPPMNIVTYINILGGIGRIAGME